MTHDYDMGRLARYHRAMERLQVESGEPREDEFEETRRLRRIAKRDAGPPTTETLATLRRYGFPFESPATEGLAWRAAAVWGWALAALGQPAGTLSADDYRRVVHAFVCRIGDPVEEVAP